MARPLVLGNGTLHIGINEFAEVADFFFPYVGLEQQVDVPRLPHKIGVWVDKQLSWLDDGSWRFTFNYHPNAMITDITAVSDKLGLALEFTDGVAVSEPAFVRNIHIVNKSSKPRSMTLFFHQAFRLGQSTAAETCQYLPEDDAIVHYKGKRVCFIGVEDENGSSFSDYSIGLSGQEGYEGTWHDAEDGILSKHPVELGRVDSTISLKLSVGTLSSRRVFYWIAVGTSMDGARQVHDYVRDTTVHTILAHTAEHWRRWLSQATPAETALPTRFVRSLQNSLFVIKAHQDKHGAIMASLDSSVLAFTRDAYAYCWPRDAAYSLWPLLRFGYKAEVVAFFSFIRRVLTSEGYVEHKYLADGSLGPSWHALVNEHGNPQLPIQTDETAAVLFLVGQYFRQYNDHRFLTDNYLVLIEPMANFLASYVGDDGLPKPSFDIWEQCYQTTTYTTALTYAALVEASGLARSFGRPDEAKRWLKAAKTMKQQAGQLYNPAKRYFHRGFSDHDTTRKFDDTVDIASLYGAFMFGLFDLESDEIHNSLETAKKLLQDPNLPGAYIRFEGDTYYQKGGRSNVWTVVSLWMAQILLEGDKKQQAERTLDWIAELIRTAPMLPEQLDPISGASTFISPLVWSHAELLNTLLDYLQSPEKDPETSE